MFNFCHLLKQRHLYGAYTRLLPIKTIVALSAILSLSIIIWNMFTPYIVMMTPATDLCGTCQLNTKIFRTVNVGEDEKRQCIAHQNEHLDRALKEREFYRNLVKSCKETLQNTEVDLLSAQAACSYQETVYYSYDYAQQEHFPSIPQQTGPIYFKTPRKCGLFGICCEGLPRQINYLIDEAVTVGKGANATIR